MAKMAAMSLPQRLGPRPRPSLPAMMVGGDCGGCEVAPEAGSMSGYPDNDITKVKNGFPSVQSRGTFTTSADSFANITQQVTQNRDVHMRKPVDCAIPRSGGGVWNNYFALGDYISVDGRRGILDWDARPKGQYMTIPRKDGESVSEDVPLDKVRLVVDSILVNSDSAPDVHDVAEHIVGVDDELVGAIPSSSKVRLLTEQCDLVKVSTEKLTRWEVESNVSEVFPAAPDGEEAARDGYAVKMAALTDEHIVGADEELAGAIRSSSKVRLLTKQCDLVKVSTEKLTRWEVESNVSEVFPTEPDEEEAAMAGYALKTAALTDLRDAAAPAVIDAHEESGNHENVHDPYAMADGDADNEALFVPAAGNIFAMPQDEHDCHRKCDQGDIEDGELGETQSSRFDQHGVPPADDPVNGEVHSADGEVWTNGLALGDTVSVDGRRGTLEWDGRPAQQYMTVRWKDDGAVSEYISAGKVRLFAKMPGKSEEAARTLTQARAIYRKWDQGALQIGNAPESHVGTFVNGQIHWAVGDVWTNGFALGDAVSVDDRRGTLEWDGRPEHRHMTVRWTDDGTVSEDIDVSKVKLVAEVTMNFEKNIEPRETGMSELHNGFLMGIIHHLRVYCISLLRILGHCVIETMYMLFCCTRTGFLCISFLLGCLLTFFTLPFFLPGWLLLNSKYFFCMYPRYSLCAGILGNMVWPLIFYLNLDVSSPIDHLNLEFSQYLKAEVRDQHLLDASNTASRRQLSKTSGRRRLREEFDFRDWKFSENTSAGQRRLSHSRSSPREELNWKLRQSERPGRRRWSSSSLFPREELGLRNEKFSENAFFGQRQVSHEEASPLIGRAQPDVMTTPRRLAKIRSSTAYTLKIFYKALDEGSGVFTKAALEEIRHFEKTLGQSSAYTSSCKTRQDASDACEAPISVSDIFYSVPDVSTVLNETVQVCYDGSGSLASVPAILESFLSNSVEYWHDYEFSETNLKSQYTRAIFYGGRNDTDTDKDERTRQMHKQKLFSHFLKPLDDEQRSGRSRYQHIEISWREADLIRIERWFHLSEDLRLALVAIMFVLIIMFLNIGSLFPFLCGLVGIILAFTTAIFCQKYLWGFPTLSALDLVSLFIISGLAADNLILVYHCYSIEKKQTQRKTKLMLDRAPFRYTQERAKCLWEALRKSWPAILATTASTCLSFYSNAASPVTVVKGFGLFMGTLAMCNAINVFVIFAPSILVCDANPWFFFSKPCLHRSLSKICFDSQYRSMKKRVLQHSTAFSYASILACLLLSAMSVFLAYASFETTPNLNIWPRDINLGRDAIELENFQTSSRQSLERARSIYPSLPAECAKNIVTSCPHDKNLQFCSEQGYCAVETGHCDCSYGFFGPACSDHWKAGALELVPEPLLRHVYVLSPIHDKVPLSLAPYIVNVSLQNQGDTQVDWECEWRLKPDRISLSSGTAPRGIVPRRSFDKHDTSSPGTVDIELNISLAGTPSTWFAEGELVVTSSTPWVRDKWLKVISYVARPPGLDVLALVADETGAPTIMTPGFDSRFHSLPSITGQNLLHIPAQVIYMAFAPFSVAAVKVHATPSRKSQVSKILVGEDEIEVDADGVSHAIPLPGRWPRKLNITVLVSSLEIGVKPTTYTVQVTRGNPPWSEFMYGNLTLNVTSCRQLDTDYGRNRLANGIITAAAVDITMLYRLDLVCFAKRAVVKYGIEIPPGDEYSFGDVKANLELMMDDLHRFDHVAFKGGTNHGIEIITAATYMDDLLINLPTTTTVTLTGTSTFVSTTSSTATLTHTTRTSITTSSGTGTTATSTASSATPTTMTASLSSTSTTTSTMNTVTLSSSSKSSTTRSGRTAILTTTTSAQTSTTLSTTFSRSTLPSTDTSTTTRSRTITSTTTIDLTSTRTGTTVTSSSTVSSTNTGSSTISLTTITTTSTRSTTGTSETLSASISTATVTTTLTSISPTTHTFTVTDTGQLTSFTSTLVFASQTLTTSTLMKTSLTTSLTLLTFTTPLRRLQYESKIDTVTMSSTITSSSTDTHATITASTTRANSTFTHSTTTSSRITHTNSVSSTSSTPSITYTSSVSSTSSTPSITYTSSVSSTSSTPSITYTSSVSSTSSTPSITYTSSVSSTSSTPSITYTSSVTSTSSTPSVTYTSSVSSTISTASITRTSSISSTSSTRSITSISFTTSISRTATRTISSSSASSTTSATITTTSTHTTTPSSTVTRITSTSSTTLTVSITISATISTQTTTSNSTSTSTASVSMASSTSSIATTTTTSTHTITTSTTTTRTMTTRTMTTRTMTIRATASLTSSSETIGGISATSATTSIVTASTSSNTTQTPTLTSTPTFSTTGTSHTTTGTTSTDRYPEGSDIIEGFIIVEVGNCAALDTNNGRMHLARGILALALDNRTGEVPADRLLKHWEDRKNIYVRVDVQCGSNIPGARMLSGTQAIIQYNLLMISAKSIDDMRTLFDFIGFASPPDFNSFLRAWGGEVVRMAELNVLNITTPQLRQDEYCPGTPYCSGRGTCTRTIPKKLGGPSWFCICDMTYTGTNCSTRVCPPCVAEEGCAEGNQTPNSIWECICPNNCSSGGQCDTRSGICKCDPMYKEIDCSVVPVGRPPLHNCIEVSLVWGLKGYMGANKSDPEYDENFDFFDPKAQEFIQRTCKDAMLSGDLMVREEQPCWIDIFRKYVVNVNGTFPVLNDEGSEALQSFMHYKNWAYTPEFNDVLTRQEQGLISGFRGDIETAGLHFTGRVKYVRLRMRSNMAVTDSNRKELREKWEEFLAARMKDAPSSVGRPFMVGQVWAEMSLESDIQMGVATGMVIALGGSLLVVGFLLRRVGLALLVVVNMILVVCVIAGFLLCIHDYKFGPVEGIGSSVMVGMGVDYCLHLTHGYKQVPKKARNRAAHAVKQYSGPILGGAMTTTAGVFVLTQCKMILFQKLGWALSSNALISASYTFFFLAPCLVLLDHNRSACSRRRGRGGKSATQPDVSIAGVGRDGDSLDIHSETHEGEGEDSGEGEGGDEHVGEGNNEGDHDESSVADGEGGGEGEGEGERAGEGSNEGGYGESSVAVAAIRAARAAMARALASFDHDTVSSCLDEVDLEEDVPVEHVSSCLDEVDLEEDVPVEHKYPRITVRL